MSVTRIPVVLLEPDQWRYQGMATILNESGDAEVIGAPDYAQLLTAEQPPDGLHPRVCIVAHRLIVEYGLAVIPQLKEIFPDCAVLVHGEADSVEAEAQVMAVGASGYFELSEPSGYLSKAVVVLSQGKLWGPREAVALMAQRAVERVHRQQLFHRTGDFSEDELMLLRFLHEGLSNKEIANRLQISEVTVKARFGRLYKRFGVATRLQLLSAAIRQGLVVG